MACVKVPTHLLPKDTSDCRSKGCLNEEPLPSYYRRHTKTLLVWWFAKFFGVQKSVLCKEVQLKFFSSLEFFLKLHVTNWQKQNGEEKFHWTKKKHSKPKNNFKKKKFRIVGTKLYKNMNVSKILRLMRQYSEKSKKRFWAKGAEQSKKTYFNKKEIALIF